MTGSSPSRILVRGVNWLGDAVITMPALQRLREALPQAHISLLTSDKLTDLWTNHPSINSVLPFTAEDSAWSLGRRLRRKNFDTALILPNSPRSALECWLARIPTRIGYARPFRNVFLTKAVPDRSGHVRARKRSEREIRALVSVSPLDGERAGVRGRSALPANVHQIYDYLHLVALLGAYSEPIASQIVVTAAEMEEVSNKFNLPTSAQSPLVGLNAGAAYGPAKRWPVERFISAAAEIQKLTRCTWLIVGGASDVATASNVASALAQTPGAATSILNLAGKTTLRELCVLLKHCRVLLTNDSGPMHLAAAVGTPVVVPFGSTSPEMTGPGLPGDPKHRILYARAPCSPCFLRECPIDFRCMNAIGKDGVVEAVRGFVS